MRCDVLSCWLSVETDVLSPVVDGVLDRWGFDPPHAFFVIGGVAPHGVVVVFDVSDMLGVWRFVGCCVVVQAEPLVAHTGGLLVVRCFFVARLDCFCISLRTVSLMCWRMYVLSIGTSVMTFSMISLARLDCCCCSMYFAVAISAVSAMSAPSTLVQNLIVDCGIVFSRMSVMARMPSIVALVCSFSLSTFVGRVKFFGFLICVGLMYGLFVVLRGEPKSFFSSCSQFGMLDRKVLIVSLVWWLIPRKCRISCALLESRNCLMAQFPIYSLSRRWPFCWASWEWKCP